VWLVRRVAAVRGINGTVTAAAALRRTLVTPLSARRAAVRLPAGRRSGRSSDFLYGWTLFLVHPRPAPSRRVASGIRALHRDRDPGARRPRARAGSLRPSAPLAILLIAGLTVGKPRGGSRSANASRTSSRPSRSPTLLGLVTVCFAMGFSREVVRGEFHAPWTRPAGSLPSRRHRQRHGRPRSSPSRRLEQSQLRGRGRCAPPSAPSGARCRRHDAGRVLYVAGDSRLPRGPSRARTTRTGTIRWRAASRMPAADRRRGAPVGRRPRPDRRPLDGAAIMCRPSDA